MAVYKLRVIEKTEDGGVIRLTCEDEDTSVYTATVTGGTGSGDPGEVGELKVRGPTWLEVIDLPLLATSDGSAGLFLAAGSVLDNWPGAVIYRSVDGGVSFDDIATITQRSVLGTAQTRLQAWPGANLLDNCSSVIVKVHGGSLASCSFERLLAGDNLCVLGSELLQFRTATQLTPGRWLLTDFLRYRGGTERFAETHLPGERFVLIDRAAILPLESDQLGRQVIYRAVTSGSPVTAGVNVTVTETHESLRPLAPVHLAVGRISVAAGYRATWRRRTRAPAPWLSGSDAPVDDAPERYRVRVWYSPEDTINTVVTEPQITFGAGQTLTYHQLQVTQLARGGADGHAARTVIE
jgi:hypothetical protein